MAEFKRLHSLVTEYSKDSVRTGIENKDILFFIDKFVHIPFEECTVEVLKNRLKFTFILSRNRTLFIHTYNRLKTMEDQVFYTYFKDKKLSFTDIRNIDTVIEKFKA